MHATQYDFAVIAVASFKQIDPHREVQTIVAQTCGVGSAITMGKCNHTPCLVETIVATEVDWPDAH
jgi:hypothetical protein